MILRRIRAWFRRPPDRPRVDQALLRQMPSGKWYCPKHKWTVVQYEDGCGFCDREAIQAQIDKEAG